MSDMPHADRTGAPEWAAYGIRDAIVFVAGFVLAIVLILPFA